MSLVHVCRCRKEMKRNGKKKRKKRGEVQISNPDNCPISCTLIGLFSIINKSTDR